MMARALSYLAVGDNKSAAGDLDRAVQLDPQNSRAWTSRGLAYERLGAEGQSRRFLRQGAQHQRQI